MVVCQCQRCGTQNPLGRVFCGNCGHKLNMSQVGGNFRQGKRFEWKKLVKVLNWLVAPAVTALIVCTMLKFWPNEVVLPKTLEKSQADALAGQLRGIEEMGLGQSATVVLREDDINAYFKYNRLDEMELEGFRVKLEKGFIEVRTRKALEMRIGKFVPRQTYDLLCVPYGRKLLVRKAAAGHLPLWGPFRNKAIREVKQLLLGGPEHKLLKDVTGIEIEKNELRVSIKK